MLTLETKKSLGYLTDEQFFQLCLENRDLRIEQNSEGQIFIMAPTGGETGNRNSTLVSQLWLWNHHSKLGLVFDSSTGFKLPNGSTRSPDASWVEKSRWQALTSAERKVFPPICPDFVVEIKSPTDDLITLQAKMLEWLANGCRLAWLINPETEITYIYRPNQALETLDTWDTQLSGEAVLPDFIFDLKQLRLED
ncbi:MAG: Uma2 family endonuclease [Microscillaceae bacterium]|jgi:Uma2 family endonuclease|nr:Uma2 family endonuclease [Microscillaceae bacterium]